MTTPAQIRDLLLSGKPAEAAAAIAAGSITGLDLSGLDLSGVDLSGVRLDGANLSGADLRTATFGEDASRQRTVLIRCDLRGANLSGRTLSLWQVDLSESDLRGANLSEVCIDGPDAEGGTDDTCKLSRLRLDGADLSGADLDGVTFFYCDLVGANLARVGGVFDFEDCDLTGATLAAATPMFLVLVGCKAPGLDLTGLTCDGELSFEDCDLAGATFAGLTCRELTWEACDLSGADLAVAAGALYAIDCEGVDQVAPDGITLSVSATATPGSPG